jgi:hypothetical protein
MEWAMFTNANGYGVTRYNGKACLAHRVSYEISKGDIGGACVCHSCDNPSCVNPEHLFLGTHKDNMDDMRSKGRKWSKLSFEDVAEIRRSNESSESLSVKYGVSARTIRYAKDATHWMPLPSAQTN